MGIGFLDRKVLVLLQFSSFLHYPGDDRENVAQQQGGQVRRSDIQGEDSLARGIVQCQGNTQQRPVDDSHCEPSNQHP